LISQTPKTQTINRFDFSKPKPKHSIDFAAGQEREGGWLFEDNFNRSCLYLSVGMQE
jgi:hypothetical protein